jgi:hypothetical protein
MQIFVRTGGYAQPPTACFALYKLLTNLFEILSHSYLHAQIVLTSLRSSLGALSAM